MKIQLLQTPNQTTPFTYGDLSFVLVLRMFKGRLYANVSVNGENVICSRRVVAGENLLRCDYMASIYGTLTFWSKYNTDVEDYTAFNNSVYLEYVPPEEDE